MGFLRRQSVLPRILMLLLATLLLAQEASADIGIVSFYVPELYALLDAIEEEGNPVETYIYGARKFYVTEFKGHNVVAVNTGVGISNAASTVAILLQKFPTIDRLVGSGIAGGVDPSLNVGDVVIPEQWILYQKQHFAKEVEEGHEIPGFQIPTLVGEDCGAWLSGSGSSPDPCAIPNETYNYTFIYPTATYGANPEVGGEAATVEGDYMYGWFNVDPEMYNVAASVAETLVLDNDTEELELNYTPSIVPGGSGVAGPTFLDNAEYRRYVFEAFGAKCVDMESPALAHVAAQFGKKFIIFRSLSDLAGGESEGNVIGVFYQVAAANAVAMLSAFLEELPVENNSPEMPTPNDHSPGESTTGLLGVLSFYEPELETLKAIMNGDDEPETLTYGGRIFYRGKIHGANVVAVLTGVSTSNAAMTTALMLQLYPGIERIAGGGIAGGVDPFLRVGDVVVPEKWANYQMQIYAREIEPNVFEPVDFERDLIVGPNCGGFDGVSEFLTGEGACDYLAGEASNFGMIFPKTIQTPWPNATEEDHRISEGPTRKFWFDVDSYMYKVAMNATKDLELKNIFDGTELNYTPALTFGGNGLSGSTFVDNVRYRQYLFEEFEARCVDMETASSANIAYQHGVPFLFFRSMSDLAGADQDGNVMNVFYAVAAENAFTVMSTFIEALYPVNEGVGVGEEEGAGEDETTVDDASEEGGGEEEEAEDETTVDDVSSAALQSAVTVVLFGATTAFAWLML